MSRFLNKNNCIYLFLSLIYLAGIVTWLYCNDFTTAHVDDTNYVTKGFYFRNYSANGILEFIKSLLFIHTDKPPLLIYYFAFLSTLFGSFGYQFVISFGIISLNILFLVNLYFFFKQVFHDKVARNYCLAFFMVCPLLFSVSKLAVTEILMLNCILLSLNLIKRWGQNINSKKAFWLGLVIALGAYSKATFIAFVALPLFFYKDQLLKEWKNFVLGFSIVVPWYIVHLFPMLGRFIKAANFERHTDGEILSPDTIVNYSVDLVSGFGLVSFIAMVVLVAKNFQKIKLFISDSYQRLIFVMPLVFFFAFFLINNKNERFQYVPFFFFVLLIAIIISKSKNYIIASLAILMQLVISIHLCFVSLLSLPAPRVLYLTKPYPKFFNSELEAKLNKLFKKDNGITIRVGKVVKDHGIEVEFQREKKNPRSIDDQLLLLKATHGYVNDYLHEPIAYLMSEGYLFKNKRYQPKKTDLMVKVEPISRESQENTKHYTLKETIGTSPENDIKLLLYSIAN